MMKKQKQNSMNEGITLLGLIVTIVLLLIIAGVAVSMITGERKYF